MSIAASSVTLAAWSSSWVKSGAGGSGSGCSALAAGWRFGPLQLGDGVEVPFVSR